MDELDVRQKPTLMKASHLGLFTILTSCTSVVAEAPKPDGPTDQILLAMIKKKGSWESNLVGDLLKPFDHRTLVRMASQHPNIDERELADLILRAAAEKDVRFRYLLDQKELRKDINVDLALHALDYSVNGNQKALEAILSRHVDAVDQESWESLTVLVLAYVDEWNLVKKAIESRRLSADGAGSDAQYAFWLRRRYLFPSNKQFPDSFETFSSGVMEQQNRAESGHRD